MKRLASLALIICLGLSAAPVLAQDRTPAQAAPQQNDVRQHRRERREKRFERRFHSLDANHDGVINRDEWKRRPQAFDRMDTNHDGVLSQDELRARGRAIARHRRR